LASWGKNLAGFKDLMRPFRNDKQWEKAEQARVGCRSHFEEQLAKLRE
jgi:hypothetical protein